MAAAVGLAAAVLASDRTGGTDLEPLFAASRAWLNGVDAYSVQAAGWTFPSLHPFPAILLVTPLLWSPIDPAVIFAALASGWWAWELGKRSRHAWWALPTFVWISAVRMAQWSPVLVAAALSRSWAGGLLVCKPSIALALWVAYPSLRSAAAAGLITLVSLALWPTWPWSWWQALGPVQHFSAPVSYASGPLVLAALWRWRDPEARLLAALACVPQSAFLYDALPLFLIPRRPWEGATLAIGALLLIVIPPALVPQGFTDPFARYLAERQITGQWMVWLLYLPCLVMVLRRRTSGGPDHARDVRDQKRPEGRAHIAGHTLSSPMTAAALSRGEPNYAGGYCDERGPGVPQLPGRCLRIGGGDRSRRSSWTFVFSNVLDESASYQVMGIRTR